MRSSFARLAVGLPALAALACQPAARSVTAASSAFSESSPAPSPVASAAPAGAFAKGTEGVSAPLAAPPSPPPLPATATRAVGDDMGLDSLSGMGLAGGGTGSIGHGFREMGHGAAKMAPSAAPARSLAAAAGEGMMGVLPATPPAYAFGGPSIAAGEWDDNANYHEFLRYLANEESLPLHRVDVSDRRFLVVRDSAGKPVPRCRVTVTDPDQRTTTLTTMASGRAILFPHAEGLGGQSLVADAACPGMDAHAHKDFAMVDQDGAVDLRVAGQRDLPGTRPVDVAFILDTTGSMGEEIDAVRSTIAKVARELGRQNFQVRLGMVEYKDRGDVFVTKVHPFSTSSDRFLADVARVNASGGGDLPESVNEGLHAGLTGLEWNHDAVARFAFLIGDAPPHLDYANDFDYAVEMKRAAHEGIQLFTVAASGMDGLGQAVWRQVAEYTGATNLFVLRGGAGPQSTGAGDPKSSCGGTQTSYSSGNLDKLIVGKITHELAALDGDAMRIAGLYKDEDAKPCNERVAMMQ